jgi:serine protease SohB
MFAELFLFAGKALIILVVFASLILLIALMVARATHAQELEIEPLHSRLKDMGFFLKSFRLGKDQLKAEQKKQKEEHKKESKEKEKKVLFVLRFDGDIKASQVEDLREEVSAILQACQSGDEVLCVVESPGGVVNGYGFAASQLLRLREAGLHLTVAVDQVAASGGYMMACVAHQIIAAPFAVVGSIGVVAQLPNFNRLLKKHEVDYREYTSGEFKRTVSLFGEITPKGEQKFLEQLEQTHGLFKSFVSRFRPQVDLSKVATGEYWYGEQAISLGLIDKIQTSDDFVLEKLKKDASILEVHSHKPKSLQEKVAEFMGKVSERALLRVLTSLEKQKFF